MNKTSKFLIHPGFLIHLIFWFFGFSNITGKQITNGKYLAENTSQVQVSLRLSTKINRRHSVHRQQRQQRNRREPHSDQSPTFSAEGVTQMNSNEPYEEGRSDYVFKNVIKLRLPNGEVEISIKNRQENGTLEAAEILVESLKQGISRLGYTLHSTSPHNMKPNRGTDVESDVAEYQGSTTGRMRSDPGQKLYVQDARGLDLEKSGETAVESQTVYDAYATIEGLAYTEYDEFYGYSQNESLVDQFKSEEYTYLSYKDTENDAGQHDTDYREGKQRSNMERNETYPNKGMGYTEKAHTYYENYMSPADEEYDNFGRPPACSRAPRSFFSVLFIDHVLQGFVPISCYFILTKE